jgi:hypothetical protein
MDGREMATLIGGECPCCLARWLYEESMKMEKH